MRSQEMLANDKLLGGISIRHSNGLDALGFTISVDYV